MRALPTDGSGLHAQHFSPGIEKLLTVHAIVEKFGMGFLSTEKDARTRREEEIWRRAVFPKGQEKQRGRFDFDVAVSFAGTERQYAERLATIVQSAGFNVFYDNFFLVGLWGKDLAEFFDDIYRKRSRHCVMFVSAEYARRMWTTHERRSALARRVEERGGEYILPVRVDDTELPGLPPTIGYLSLAQHAVETIAEILIEKLVHERTTAQWLPKLRHSPWQCQRRRRHPHSHPRTSFSNVWTRSSFRFA